MIEIVNVSEIFDPFGPQVYEVRVNRNPVVTFTHKRSEGMAECLRKAAGAITKQGYDLMLDLPSRRESKR